MKNDIRKEMLLIRKNIPNKKKKSTVIVDKIINLDLYQKSKVIAIYNSLVNEVDTSELIKRSIHEKIVLLPKIINDKMVFIIIDNNTKSVKNNFGIYEPIGKIYDGDIDLIIVPGVAFDRRHFRLGFGKGYYDKYLKEKNIYKIGICFIEQIVDYIPIDSYDVPMNMIITEKEFF